MPTLKNINKYDPRYQNINFIEESESYVLEITPTDEKDIHFVSGKIQSLFSGLKSDGHFPDFLVDREIKDKIRVTGDINEAIVCMQKEEDQLHIFHETVYKAIEKDLEIQKILKKCNHDYKEDTLTKQDSFVNTNNITKDQRIFSPLKKPPFEESKENELNKTQATSQIIQRPIKK